MKTLKYVVAVASAMAGLFAWSSAQALTITPSTPGVTSLYINPPSNCEPGCVYTQFGLVNDGSLQLLYKADVGNSDSPATLESGSFAGSYGTVFSNTEFDPEDATISYTGGGAITCGVCYLVIKDGNTNPNYYFFDLAAAGWNGTETIYIQDFWIGRGSISHVSIWGVDASVPEPGTLGLLGLGLAGMGISLRRRRKP